MKDVGTLKLGDGGRLRAAITDFGGAPVPYAQVHILGSKLESRWDSPYTDLDGRVEFERVAPGTYTVFVVSPHHPLRIERNVQILEGRTKNLRLAFPRSSPLRITVLDPSRVPVQGAKLIYTFQEILPFTSEHVGDYEPPAYGSNLSDADGVIFKPHAPAMRVTLRIVAEGFAQETRTVRLKGGEETRIEFRLKRK